MRDNVVETVRDVCMDLSDEPHTYTRPYVRSHICSLFLLVFRPTYTYSLVRASLLIYSHEFACIYYFQQFDFIPNSFTYVEQNLAATLRLWNKTGDYTHVSFDACEHGAKGEKINKTRKRTKQKKKKETRNTLKKNHYAKPKRFI